MREPLPVDLRLAGRDAHGMASVIRDPSELTRAFEIYAETFPNAHKARGDVLVCVDLDSADSEAATHR